FVIGNIVRWHESAIGERHTKQGRLRAHYGLPVLAGRLVPGATVRACVVRGEERSDHELATPDRGDPPADLLDNAAVFVTHRGWYTGRLNAAVWPEVRSAD